MGVVRCRIVCIVGACKITLTSSPTSLATTRLSRTQQMQIMHQDPEITAQRLHLSPSSKCIHPVLAEAKDTPSVVQYMVLSGSKREKPCPGIHPSIHQSIISIDPRPNISRYLRRLQSNQPQTFAADVDRKVLDLPILLFFRHDLREPQDGGVAEVVVSQELF